MAKKKAPEHDRHIPWPDAHGAPPHHLEQILHRLEQIMAILQAITDAQARLDAAVAANTAKVDELLSAATGTMSPAEQQTVADAINASAGVVEATNAKS